MPTILRDDIDKGIGKEKYEEAYKIEADVIVTAVVLGFIGTRYHLNQPCRFDYEHPSPDQQKEWEASDHVKNNKNTPKDYDEFLSETGQFEHVLSAMTFVIDKTEPEFGSFLKGEQSPESPLGATYALGECRPAGAKNQTRPRCYKHFVLPGLAR